MSSPGYELSTQKKYALGLAVGGVLIFCLGKPVSSTQSNEWSVLQISLFREPLLYEQLEVFLAGFTEAWKAGQWEHTAGVVTGSLTALTALFLGWVGAGLWVGVHLASLHMQLMNLMQS